MSNFVDLTFSSGNEGYNRPRPPTGQHISGIGYTGLPPRRQGYGYPNGVQDPRRGSVPPLLPSVAQVVANAPSAAYGYPPHPHQELAFARTKLPPLASTPPAKFEEMTGGRLPSPPPNQSPVALSTASETRSYKHYFGPPQKPPPQKSIPKKPSPRKPSPQEPSPQKPSSQKSSPAKARLRSDGSIRHDFIHNITPRLTAKPSQPIVESGNGLAMSLTDPATPLSGKDNSPLLPVNIEASNSGINQLADPPSKGKNNIGRSPNIVNNHRQSPRENLKPALDQKSLAAVDLPNKSSPTRGQSSYLAKILQPTSEALPSSSKEPSLQPKVTTVTPKELGSDLKPKSQKAPKGGTLSKSGDSMRPTLLTNSNMGNQMDFPVSLSPDAFQRYLRAFIKKTQSEHEYYIKSRLAQARQMSGLNNSIKTTLLRKSTSGHLVRNSFRQNYSPFAEMKALRPEPPGVSRSTQKLGKLCQLLPKVLKPGNETTNSFRLETYKAPATIIPIYWNCIPTRRNVLVEDDKHRTFLPYLGDAKSIDPDYAALEQVIEKNQAQYHHMNALAEKASFYCPNIEEILVYLGCDLESVLQYLLYERKPVPLDLPREFESIWRDREIHIQHGYYEESDDSDTTKPPEAARKRKPQRQWKQASENLKKTTNGRKMAAASMACDAFLKVTGFSLWHIVKKSKSAQAAANGKARNDSEEGSASRMNATSSPETNMLSTYIDLGCLVCKCHECPGHGEYEDEDDEKNIRVRINHKTCSPKQLEDEIPDTDTSQEMLEQGAPSPEKLLGLNDDHSISGEPVSRFVDEEDPLHEQELCSEDCFWLKSRRSKVRRKSAYLWSDEDFSLLNTLRAAYENDRRGPCMIARSQLISKSCMEIFHKLISTDPKPVTVSFRKQNEASSPLAKAILKRPLEYWHDNFRTHLHHERQVFIPCNHLGPCDDESNCDCFKLNVTCEKSCACASACSRRYRGCLCATRGKVCWQNQGCDCFRLNRECDPDLCRSCGVHDILDPTNRYRFDILQGRCANAFIQRGMPKRTLLGPSKMLMSGGKPGWGLYMGEACKKGDFIGEYVGEIVSRAEAEKRGTIYDIMDMSYLFDLNDTQTLDSTLFGNKTRFINHMPEKSTNCYAKTMFCNNLQRIGMFAAKDIAISEELFFNYGEGFASKVGHLITNSHDGANDLPTIETHHADTDELTSERINRHFKGTLSKNGRRIGRPPKHPHAVSIKPSAKETLDRSREAQKPGHKRRRSEAMLDDSMNEALVVGLEDLLQTPELPPEEEEDDGVDNNDSASSFEGSVRLPGEITLAFSKRTNRLSRSVSTPKEVDQRKFVGRKSTCNPTSN